MTRVVIDMSMSLDGFVARPDDAKAHPLGRNGGEHIFDWYSSGTEERHDPIFRPALPSGVRLEKLSVSDGPFATHLRYRVVRD